MLSLHRCYAFSGWLITEQWIGWILYFTILQGMDSPHVTVQPRLNTFQNRKLNLKVERINKLIKSLIISSLVLNMSKRRKPSPSDECQFTVSVSLILCCLWRSLRNQPQSICCQKQLTSSPLQSYHIISLLEEEQLFLNPERQL